MLQKPQDSQIGKKIKMFKSLFIDSIDGYGQFDYGKTIVSDLHDLPLRLQDSLEIHKISLWKYPR